ncbi:ABC transporter permease [Labilibacter marinus]|uniref:ABC transporter permease n=1 Tax=Labilibacter marinus TaxID=1477105 RepID=UPI00083398FE|nr:FtsX-like permease family protein [Labilibacter marinus]
MIQTTSIKLIIRNWRRNKLFTFTAILSLVIGFACCNLLTAFVINEWKISNSSIDNDRIFALKTDNPMTLETTKEKSSWIMKKVPPLFKKRYPEINSYCRFNTVYSEAIFKSNGFKTNDIHFLQADKTIRDFFKVPIVVGNLSKTLSSPDEVAITKSWAQKVFGTADIIGEVLEMEEDKSLKKITTVIDDSYTASFISYDVLLPFNNEEFWGGVTFLKLNEANALANLQQKIDNDIKELPKFTNDCNYYLQPLTDFYFDKSESQTNWTFLLKRDSLFVKVGIFAALAILFVACFNFINLYMVRLFKSNTNNSIQRLLGASYWQLQKHILLESFITTFVGFCASLVVVILSLPIFNNLFSAHLSLSFLLDKTVILIYLLLITILTIIPTIYLGIKFKEKGFGKLLNTNSSNVKTVFSNTLITIQFGFSILLIIAAVLYMRQLNFISETANVNPNVIEIQGEDIPDIEFKTFKEQVNNLAHVEASSTANNSYLNAWLVLGDDNVATLGYNMDCDFMKVHNIHLIKGEGYSINSEANQNQGIVNETFLKKYQLDSPIGKNIEIGGNHIQIVGVVKDFHTEPFSKKVQPTIIMPYKPADDIFKTINIKFHKGIHKQEALSSLEVLWNTNFPNKNFTYSFPADDFKALHKDYDNLAEMIGFFTVISFLLTAFGLFGIACYTVEYRTKEIGIRKVNGAKTSEILSLLNKGFIKWVVLAFIITCPIAFYIMRNWLENFAYKTEFSWWIFAIAGISALGITIITVSWQSWKAATRNPVESLRYE